jgi:hypothetical protein
MLPEIANHIAMMKQVHLKLLHVRTPCRIRSFDRQTDSSHSAPQHQHQQQQQHAAGRISKSTASQGNVQGRA